MPPRKRRRACSTPRPAAARQRVTVVTDAWRLPPDILLEITARTDTVTFIRCAATCKALRREILDPDFVRRVCREPPDGGIVPGFLDRTFSLVHPATPATVSLAQDHLAPFVSRSAAGLLEQYRPVTSRGGLVLLERRSINWRRRSERPPDDMCVYDPMTNSRAFLPFPPNHEHPSRGDHLYRYVLLTPAADGIVGGCRRSFTVVAADITTGARAPLRVMAVSSDDGGEWGPASYATNPSLGVSMPVDQDNAAVIVDGVVHWLMFFSYHILTYNIGTGKAGLIELPVHRLPANWRPFESCLRLSPDGKLSLVTVHGLRVSVWLLSSEVDDDGWTRHAEVDMEPTLSSMFSSCKWIGGRLCVELQLQSSGDQRSGVVLLRVHAPGHREELLVLDMETMETSRIGEISGIPFEVNLVSRISSMQTFKINN